MPRYGYFAMAMGASIALAATHGADRAGCLTAKFGDTKLLPDEESPVDHFGRVVALGDDVAVIGSPEDDDRGLQAGAVYVFPIEHGSFGRPVKLTGSDTEIHDSFGRSVSVDGTALLVGADDEDERAYSAGAAYVFRRTAGGWVQEAKLTAFDGEPYDNFGRASWLGDDVAIVGAPNEDDGGRDAGAAYIFRRVNGAWRFEAKLLADDAGELGGFGYAVAIDGDVAVVGAYGDSEQGLLAGAVYVFRYDGERWGQEAKLLASDGEIGDAFGQAVSLAGTAILIGADGHDARGFNAGAAYVFRYAPIGWVEEARLFACDGQARDFFGREVAIDGDTAIIGAELHDERGLDAGAAYVFRRVDGAWRPEVKLVAADADELDEFGCATALRGDTVLIGAEEDEDHGPAAGAAYIGSLATILDSPRPDSPARP